MKKSLLTALAGAALAITSMTAVAQKDPDVGGAPMFANKNIIQNAVNSPIHKTLVAAVKAAGLVDTLSGPGPFTVFAPTDDAFAKLPAGTVDSLVQPENKATLVKILTYHVIAGKITSKDLIKAIKKGGGTYHVCYSVPDIRAAIDHLTGQGSHLLSGPSPAVAFEMREIAWVMTDYDVVELMQE